MRASVPYSRRHARELLVLARVPVLIPSRVIVRALACYSRTQNTYSHFARTHPTTRVYPCDNTRVFLTCARTVLYNPSCLHTLPFSYIVSLSHTHHPFIPTHTNFFSFPSFPPTLEGRAFLLLTYVHMWLCKCVAAVALSDIRCRGTILLHTGCLRKNAMLLNANNF